MNFLRINLSPILKDLGMKSNILMKRYVSLFSKIFSYLQRYEIIVILFIFNFEVKAILFINY